MHYPIDDFGLHIMIRTDRDGQPRETIPKCFWRGKSKGGGVKILTYMLSLGVHLSKGGDP